MLCVRKIALRKISVGKWTNPKVSDHVISIKILIISTRIIIDLIRKFGFVHF